MWTCTVETCVVEESTVLPIHCRKLRVQKSLVVEATSLPNLFSPLLLNGKSSNNSSSSAMLLFM